MNKNLKEYSLSYIPPKQNRVSTVLGFRSTFHDWLAESEFISKGFHFKNGILF
ncbi:hypothetical protein F904_01439 [Acinetobacter dispersus]|uniref:Uncharacterized protein n=2 Tax=Acinetobacter TaxID=469 RepID=N8UWT7_9GAMM|nr:hypothetical protein F971_03139 [Acinetobacter vivianii]ENW93383.1 hypothetical protein F904_01439 [Acinetobacter dispersus]